MKQFEYQIMNKTSGRIEYIRATARTAEIARMQIILVYGKQFDVMDLYSDINSPHFICGEIDCSDFPSKDIEWLRNKAAV
jgi:hypothetical protein